MQPLAALEGEWVGQGRGFYPTIQPFQYTEAIHFTQVGKPFFAYGQRTAEAESKRPLHAESGYLRAAGGAVELVLAQPTGVCEVDVGAVLEGNKGFEVSSSSLTRTPSAKAPHVTQLVRRFELVDANTLKITFSMATTNTPMSPHLESILHRKQ
uniref:THAP4-like heme-binding domain-containing protein n=1 Tax=Arcella intermedia TaxID=1963864 RepID=A0A6B2LMU5_9EUKA